jgi:hypothetical protein
LSQTAPSIWTYGSSPIWPPPDPNRCDICVGGIQGEFNVALAAGRPSGYTPNQAYFAVVDTTYASLVDLPVAKIENPGQTAGVAPTADSLAAAVAAGTKNADGTVTPNVATSTDGVYPLPQLTYAVVPTTQGWPNFTADDGTTLAAYLKWATTEGQSILPAGSFTLPDDLVQQTATVADKIPTTEPQPRDGGGGGNNNQSGSGTGAGGFGTGTGTGGSGTGTSTGGSYNTGGGSPAGGSNKGGPKSSGEPTGYTPTFTMASDNLSSGIAHPAVPLLILLGLLVVLLGPSIQAWTRRHELTGLPGRARSRFRSGGDG